MKTNKIKNLYLGWDIGGAHIKLSTIKPNSFSFNIYKCNLWKSTDLLKKILHSVCRKYKRGFNIINVITMSGEMCDIFDSRNQGVKHILEIFKNINKENYVFSTKKPFFFKLSKKINPESISSANWFATAKFLETKVNNAIAVDVGSTTTDIIVIKKGVCINKNYSDFSRLQSSELIYMGILRTPIHAVTKEIYSGQKKFSIIPENFSNMSDVYRILSDIKPKIDYSENCDSKNKSYRNSLVRFSRIIGFDYHSKNERIVINLAKKIKLYQKNFLMQKITYTLQQHFQSKESVNIIGIGIGSFLIEEISKKIKMSYKDFNSFCQGGRKQLFLPSDIAPAYSISTLFKLRNE